MTTAAFTSKGRLTSEQLASYHREGYLIFRDPVLPADKFNALKAHFEAKLAALPPEIRPEAMDVPHYGDAKLFDWIFADEILDLVEPVLGPNIALWSSHFICKPKGNGKRVPWHEDSYYWQKRLEPMNVCTVWLALDPSTRANGCMKVIPRTHDNGYSEYESVDQEKNVFNIEIKKHLVDESRQVFIELQPNQASLHNARLMHGSDPNTSDIRRCGYTMRFISTATKLHLDPGQEHLSRIYLARGKDIAGNRYADPNKPDIEIMLGHQRGYKNSH
jgi:hypothetical protein